MTGRAFAGIHRPGGAVGDGDVEAVVAAVGRAGPVRTHRVRDLALAWTGAEAVSLSPLRLVHGRLYAGSVAGTGDAELSGLRGDFVIVDHDEATATLTLARDQLGGEGGYWHLAGGRLAFASEVRHLLPLLDAVPPPDTAALAHWLSVSGVPVERTLFEGIHRIPAAHRLRSRAVGVELRRYWRPVYRRPEPVDPHEAAAGLRSVLTEAIGRRAAGPATGVLLSGGLDSSTVAAVASRLPEGQRPTRAYSATFPAHPTVDEGDLIAILCDRFGLDGTRAVVRGGSALAGAVEYIAHWSLPPPSPNLFFWLPLLRRVADDGVTGLLDGEGGDELFGMSPYLIADRVRRGRLLAARRLVLEAPGGERASDASVRRFMREFGWKGAAPAWLHRATRRRRAAAITPEWLRPEVRAAFFTTDEAADWKSIPGPRWFGYIVDAVVGGMGPAVGHDHQRRRAALCGIDAIHALVDVDVVDYVLGLPPELAFHPGYSRPLVRRAMEGLLPDEVRLRSGKSTFDAVFHESLAGPDLEAVRALLRPGDAEIAAFVDLAAVERALLGAPPAPGQRLWWAQQLWRLVTAECWLRVRAGRPVAGAGAAAALVLEGGGG